MIMMLLFALLTAAFIVFRVVWPLKIGKGWKAVLILLVLAACCKNQLTRLFGGPRFFAPDLPPWILLPAAWAYATALLLFFGLAILEIVRGGAKIILFCRTGHAVSEKYQRVFLKISLALIPIAAALALFGLYRGMALPAVREVELAFPNLPPSAENCRIAVLADLHADRVTRSEKIRRVVERTNGLEPDLTLVLGDLVDGTVEQRGQELLPLRDLRAKLGVYAIPGNHEYYSGYAPWRIFYSGLGLRLLENSHVRLPNGIFLAGITDPAARPFGEPVPDLRKALHGIPEKSFVLLLAHRPGSARSAAGAGVSLQLSGHTHGGMVFGIDWVVSQFNGGFVSGLYDVNGMKLYVSNGTLIWNGFPIRLGRESEITLITLKRK